ncbi:hypothetical protein F2Q70_00030392 [Brassica cretica]|uniref:Uncharacterized protein n=1 Tax=Brassica cretica TaxID=69181 RepID=A0A8S9FH53_BRACR|nr:hypothetical protein F2Q70_00030392 [Brassica cretica]
MTHYNKRNTYLVDTMRVVFNTEAHFDDHASPRMVFYIRDNIHIKCVATGAPAYAFRDGLENMKGRGQLSKMFTKLIYTGYFGPPDLWLETDGGLSDFKFNPRLPEIEEFRQSLLRSDPYVQRYGAVGSGMLRKGGELMSVDMLLTDEQWKMIRPDLGRIEKWVLHNAFDDEDKPYLLKRHRSPMTIPLNSNNINKHPNASPLLTTSLPSIDIARPSVLESMSKKEVRYAISYESDVDTGHNRKEKHFF